FDALGQRWGTDLGRDSYSLAQVGGTNYGAYRKRAEGQNTLVINPAANDYLSSSDANERALNADQVYKDATGKPAYAPVVKSLSTDLQSVGIVDLTNLYSKMRVSSVQRGFLLDRTDGSLLVQDELMAASAPQINWFMHLPVAYASRGSQIAISSDGKTATVTIGSNRLQLRILAGTGATFTIAEAAPLPTSPNPSGQASTSGVCKLAISYSGSTSERLAVWMVPLKSGQATPTVTPTITPLATWAPKANRQAWAGDLDGYAATTAGDATAASAIWSSQIATATGKSAKSFDVTTTNRITPASLSLPLTAGETVGWAKLVVALKSTGGATSTDLMYLDSTTGQTYSSLGWAAIDGNATSRELLLTAAQRTLLDDGLLNVAFGPNTTLDWVQLQYTTSGGGAVEAGVVTVAAGLTQTDNSSRSGTQPLVKRGAGTLVLTAASATSGSVIVEEGTLLVRDIAALGTGAVDVRAGASLVFDVGTAVASAGSLAIAAAAVVDVGSGGVTFVGGDSLVRQWLADGRGAGGWNGSKGIRSSAAAAAFAAGQSRSVGWRNNGNGTVTVAFAAAGDTNMDGRVDVLDVANMVSSGTFDTDALAPWSVGDFNFDGVVDVLDLSEFISSDLLHRGTYIAPNGITVSYVQTNGWTGGFTGEMTVANTRSDAVAGWTLEFDLDATITTLWNASILSRTGSRYVVTAATWNSAVAAGGSTGFGFQASGTPGSTPRNRRFNGVAV
ncbi:MAG: cellulose binding domain-containing protein, partial [Pirellulales bacterium]